jgi:hypothetical protein
MAAAGVGLRSIPFAQRQRTAGRLRYLRRAVAQRPAPAPFEVSASAGRCQLQSRANQRPTRRPSNPPRQAEKLWWQIRIIGERVHMRVHPSLTGTLRQLPRSLVGGVGADDQSDSRFTAGRNTFGCNWNRLATPAVSCFRCRVDLGDHCRLAGDNSGGCEGLGSLYRRRLMGNGVVQPWLAALQREGFRQLACLACRAGLPARSVQVRSPTCYRLRGRDGRHGA